jgi:Xaa-Pro dipeptidase
MWIHAGSTVTAGPNMVFYVHMILMDRDSGRAMALADTSVVTETGSERLSRLPLDLVVKS